MNDDPGGVTSLQTRVGYSWFLIMCSWEYEHDQTAMDKWKQVYNFLKRPMKGEIQGLRKEIADEGLLALNLIGKRKFVIAGQTKSNKPLQKISSTITLGTAIKVDVYPATNVFEFGIINRMITEDHKLKK